MRNNAFRPTIFLSFFVCDLRYHFYLSLSITEMAGVINLLLFWDAVSGEGIYTYTVYIGLFSNRSCSVLSSCRETLRQLIYSVPLQRSLLYKQLLVVVTDSDYMKSEFTYQWEPAKWQREPQSYSEWIWQHWFVQSDPPLMFRSEWNFSYCEASVNRRSDDILNTVQNVCLIIRNNSSQPIRRACNWRILNIIRKTGVLQKCNL